METTTAQRKMVEQFQCTGCVAGSDTKCGAFKPEEQRGARGTGIRCVSHVLGTYVVGRGHVALGLPTGFCRSGQIGATQDSANTMNIRLWPAGSAPMWDTFNVAVWGMEQNGHLFVRTYCPRTNRTYVDVVEGATIGSAAPLCDVGTFVDQMD